MTHCDVCHSRIYTYTKFKIEKRTKRGVSYKTVCYHCKIKDLEKKLDAVKTWLTRAKAEGRVSMNVGYSLGLVLGVEE